jgi:signal transduction histidine kinase
VAAHLGGVVDTYRVRAAGIGVKLESMSNPSVMATVDPDRLDQVCSNLIENALRYTPEHGTVTVAVEAGEHVVRLVVSDTGPGIDPADADRVFDRLYVSQRYQPVRPEGSGLGLTIVRELVDAMNGAVRVVSTPGSGSRFIVEIPV